MPLVLLLGCSQTINGPTLSIPDITFCKAISKISIGADCTTFVSQQHTQLSANDFISFLDASPTKPEAISMSADDGGKIVTSMEEMCTELKNHCTNNHKMMIKNMKTFLNLNLQQ